MPSREYSDVMKAELSPPAYIFERMEEVTPLMLQKILSII